MFYLGISFSFMLLLPEEAQLKKLFYFSIIFLLGDLLLVKAFENVEQNLHSRSNKKRFN